MSEEPKFNIGDKVVFTLGRDERQDKHRSKPMDFTGVISRIYPPNKIGRIYEITTPERRHRTFAKYEHDIRLKEES